jgi:hypothetical protein
VHHRQRQARIDPHAADQHRAGPALPVIAPLLGPRQAQMLAKQIKQRGAHVDGNLPRRPVDGDLERHNRRLAES